MRDKAVSDERRQLRVIMYRWCQRTAGVGRSLGPDPNHHLPLVVNISKNNVTSRRPSTLLTPLAASMREREKKKTMKRKV